MPYLLPKGRLECKVKFSLSCLASKHSNRKHFFKENTKQYKKEGRRKADNFNSKTGYRQSRQSTKFNTLLDCMGPTSNSIKTNNDQQI